MNNVEYSQPVESLQFPVYADQFQKAIQKINASGEKVKRVWGSTIYVIDKTGVEVQYNPEKTDRGVEFYRKASPAVVKE